MSDDLRRVVDAIYIPNERAMSRYDVCPPSWRKVRLWLIWCGVWSATLPVALAGEALWLVVRYRNAR